MLLYTWKHMDSGKLHVIVQNASRLNSSLAHSPRADSAWKSLEGFFDGFESSFMAFLDSEEATGITSRQPLLVPIGCEDMFNICPTDPTVSLNCFEVHSLSSPVCSCLFNLEFRSWVLLPVPEDQSKELWRLHTSEPQWDVPRVFLSGGSKVFWRGPRRRSKHQSNA